MTWGRCEMASSKYLRRQADLCWRLALVTLDDDVRQTFAERAQDFLARADELESADADGLDSTCEGAPDGESARSN